MRILPSLFFISAISAIEREEIAVACGKKKIEVRLEKDYLIKNGVNVANREQLHMGENTACIPIEEEDAYKFVIFAPFNSCFTKVEHETEDYVFSNQIYYNTTRQATEVFKWRCIYEDKYTVSYEHAITPIKRTLSFTTEKGQFDVDMRVYADEQYTSEISERTPIRLNTPVYVSLNLDRPFAFPEIVLTVKNCFATDQTDPSSETANWYSLISGMCVQPNDPSIVLMENGVGNNARFKFNMFKWKTRTSYIYMHCEVYLCDSDKEECYNEDAVCSGTDRVRRNAELGPNDEEVVTEFKPTFMSKGPIIIDEDIIESVGKAEINRLEIDFMTDNEFLRLYIIVTICTVLAFVGILIGIIAVVIRRRAQQQKELFVSN